METTSDPAPVALPPASQLAFAIVLVHIVLVASLGNAYAKIQVVVEGIQVYPTEIVVLCIAVLGIGSIAAVPWDALTKLVAGFVVFGVGWVLLAGIGDLAGPGAKAFSFFVYAVFYFVVRGTARTTEERWRVLRAIAIAAVAGAAIGLFQMVTGTFAFGSAASFEVTSTGSTRWLGGDFALYGLFAISIVSIGAFLQRRLSRESVVVLIAASLEILLAQHRSGFVALAAVLLGTVVLLGGSSDALRGFAKLAIVAIVALVVFAYLFGGVYLNETLTRIASTSDIGDQNISWRLLNWYEVFDGITLKPWGHGFAVWDFWFNYRDPLTGSHNSLLDLAYRIGVPGLVVFLAMPIVLIRRTRALVRETGPQAQALLLTVCACLLAYLVFASFNMVFESPDMSVFFWIFLGIGAGTLPVTKRDPAPSTPESALALAQTT